MLLLLAKDRQPVDPAVCTGCRWLLLQGIKHSMVRYHGDNSKRQPGVIGKQLCQSGLLRRMLQDDGWTMDSDIEEDSDSVS